MFCTWSRTEVCSVPYEPIARAIYAHHSLLPCRYDRVYPLALVSPVSKAVAEAARSQLEWMSDSVGKVG